MPESTTYLWRLHAQGARLHLKASSAWFTWSGKQLLGHRYCLRVAYETLFCAATAFPSHCDIHDIVSFLCEGKERCPLWPHVKWRHKETARLENQEVRIEQHVHCLNPAQRDLLFIYPLPTRIHTQGWHKARQKSLQTLLLKQSSSSMCPLNIIFRHKDRNIPLMSLNNSSWTWENSTSHVIFFFSNIGNLRIRTEMEC